jgi:hypothetical protein
MVLTLCLAAVSLYASPALAGEPTHNSSVQDTDCPVASVELAAHARRTTPVVQAYMCRMPEQPWDPGLAKQGKKVDETSESEVKRTLIGCSPRHGGRNADGDPHLASHVSTKDQRTPGLSLLNGVPAGRAPPGSRAH